MRVPQDKYYGAQTQRAVENFPISGLRLPRRFIRAQGLVKYAAAHANRVCQALDEQKATAVMQAAQEVVQGKWDDHFVVDVYQAGAGTSQNMNANEVIANRATELLGGEVGDTSVVHPNDHVNMGQSTNDTIHVAINIAAAEGIAHDLLPELTRLIQSLRKKAEAFHDVIKSGRTHLQDAVPIRLGQEFSGYAGALELDVRAIEEAQQLLFKIGLGGNAVGTGINTPPRYAEIAVGKLRELTGLPFVEPDDRFTFMQNTNGAMKTAAALKNLAVHLIKIARDLRLLSSGPRTGLAEIRLPAVQPGSSIMPGKINPVIPEMMNMIGCQVIGCEAVITSAGQHAELEINVLMPVIAFNLLHAIEILANGMKVFRQKCVDGIVADEAQCQAWVERSLSLVTALNPLIGYDRAAEVAKEAFETGKTLRQVVLDRGLMDEKQLDDALKVNRMV